jgi:hypothetical protein
VLAQRPPVRPGSTKEVLPVLITQIGRELIDVDGDENRLDLRILVRLLYDWNCGQQCSFSIRPIKIHDAG